jgi:NTP pyrophosphatase (non-canonical NTP hydrolase)
MDRKIFEENFKTASNIVEKEKMNKIISEALTPLEENYTGTKNLVIVMEEFMEAGQEVSKYIRGKGDIISLTEELADAYLSIKYVQKICNISDENLNKAINVKLDREKNRTIPKEEI